MTLFFHVVLMLCICCSLVDASYLMAAVVGDGSGSTSGDGGPATSAGISNFYGMWIDSVGNLYLPDNNALKFRKVNTSGIINTFVGSGNLNNTGAGGTALSVSLDGAGCAWGDTAGNMYLSSSQYYIWFYNHTSGYVSRYAGAAGGNVGYSGDGGPATSAGIAQPLGLFLSTTGILYFADSGNNVIRAIDTKTTIITTFAGKQGASVLGDGGPATSAMMSPFGVWGNTAGVIFITDTNYNRIRKVVNGNITTIAGTGNANYNGDDIAATVADLYNPYNCQEDTLGNLYIADTINNRVRVVSAVTGNITTIAGNGLPWSSNGSLHVATAVGLSPSMIQLDTAGTIYFGDGGYVRLLFLATATPTATPSAVPSAFPTPTPSFVPSALPSEMPSVVPSAIPTVIPTIVPSVIPSEMPSFVPSAIPSEMPSVVPTAIPTMLPTVVPSAIPSEMPSVVPSAIPTIVPSAIPSVIPTIVPSPNPSNIPTIHPTVVPSFRPSVVNVTIDSSSNSHRLSDLHIFYATFFPAFFIVFCILPIIVYHVWKTYKANKQLKYDQINLNDVTGTTTGRNNNKTNKVERFYEWSL